MEDELGGAWSVDQADLEQDLQARASREMREQQLELDAKQLERSKTKLARVRSHHRTLQMRLSNPQTLISQKARLKDDLASTSREIESIERDIHDIRHRMSHDAKPLSNTPSDVGRRVDETDHEYLVRTGRITPFSKNLQPENEEDQRSHRDLAKPAAMLERRVKHRRIGTPSEMNLAAPEIGNKEHVTASDDDFSPSAEELDELISDAEEDISRAEGNVNEQEKDDGNLDFYLQRLKRWSKQRRLLRPSPSDIDEWRLPHPAHPDAILDAKSGFRIPGDIWSSLFAYQKTSVRWLWELYSQRAGGIIGDEMGLGKTVQIAAFIAGLHYSGLLEKPVLVVCPATVLHQWVAELHQWWPPLRVAILHSIGSGFQSFGTESDSDDFGVHPQTETATYRRARALLKSVADTGHVIVTSYAGVRSYESVLLPTEWGYCVLDEGHKIRNPNSEIALACKQIKTNYRIILSGTPIQNNLTELWSLFDFVFPGRLGTLPVFQQEFALPINLGGYANATNIQVQTAYKCAVALRNIITPYMLRRMKSDVATDLPQKSEKVLFCRLTKSQREAYELFLKSEELQSILKGKRQVLYGIDILRKICNHPDLVDRVQNEHKRTYGDPSRSGKMQVVKALIDLWSSQGHRTLLFAQTRQMLDILEPFIASYDFEFLRMDGTTPIGRRQQLVNRFNSEARFAVFLLTTKVGGLGVNLTGADRVIIYDPDWNPSTDMQARERAWRLGQQNDVIIYRLMIAGAIEEKIYHRQIFKQFLSNKILKDPRQKRFFKSRDLRDLFTLSSGSESEELFGQQSKKEDDLESIRGIKKEGDYRSEETQSRNATDDGLLQGIFAKAGVQGTLEHEKVLDADRPDTVLINREATRVANQALNALRESRRTTRRFAVGTPTWTGQFGSAGKTSGSILAGLRQKKDLESKANSETALPREDLERYTETLKRLHEYLASRSEQKAKSTEIVKACHIELSSAQDVANLRQMLRKIAHWLPNSQEWHLKDQLD